MNTIKDKSIAEITQTLFDTVDELELRYPGRKFTIDGHLLGSIGEVIVADHYGLTLLKNSRKTHDAIDCNGRMVQIKTTQINRISISSKPDYLIVIQINSVGNWIEIYNGKGERVWDQVGKKQTKTNGQCPISIAKLKKLMESVEDSEKIVPHQCKP